MRVRVKICGITRGVDVDLAVAAGADAIGMVFWPASSRAVTLASARQLRAAVPAFVTAVALFVNPTVAEVQRVLDEVGPDVLQFHGDEEENFCAGFGIPYIKAVKVMADAGGAPDVTQHNRASALLLDSFDPVRIGGTGRTFDWQQVPRTSTRRLIVAGGLDAANVGQAIGQLRPYAVDVSSGVETAPGRKDPDRMASFMRAVTVANERLREEDDMVAKHGVKA